MKNRSLLDSFSNALQGVIHALIFEKNFRIHFAISFLVLTGSLLLDLSVIEYLIVAISIAAVLITELINTAIEALVDLIVHDSYKHLARIAKDTAAGAVFISACLSIIVGYMIIFRKIILIGLTLDTFEKIQRTPVHITLICIIITIMLSVALKAFTKAENYFHGGMPSAHAALAFAIATCIAYTAQNELAVSLSFFLALLVAQSRVEGKIHSYLQVIAGSALGFLITTLFYQAIQFD